MMSSLFLRLCKALRSEGLRLSCLGYGGLCLAMSDSTLQKYPEFVEKSDWQPPKLGRDPETFITSVESAKHKPPLPKHDRVDVNGEVKFL